MESGIAPAAHISFYGALRFAGNDRIPVRMFLKDFPIVDCDAVPAGFAFRSSQIQNFLRARSDIEKIPYLPLFYFLFACRICRENVNRTVAERSGELIR